MINKVIDILSEYTEMDKEKMTTESNLLADLLLSSLDVINVVVAFEDEFGIEIPDRDISEFTTVGDIVKYLSDKV